MHCTHCGLRFELAEAHYYLSHLGKKENRCLFCAKLFDNNHLMFDHIVEHDGSIYCYFCKAPSENYELLLDHINIHPELHVYGCDKCRWTTANKITFLDHVCQFTRENSDDSGVESNPTIRKILNKTHSNINLKLKFREEGKKEKLLSKNVSSEPLDPNNLKFIVKRSRKNGFYYCSDCPKRFKTLRGCRYHLLKHNNLLKFVCEKCDKKFPTNSKLKDHRKIHDTDIKFHRCPECGSHFKSKYSLAVHIAKHRGFHCANCSTKFTRKCSLKNHLEIQECCREIFQCRKLFALHLASIKHTYHCQHCPNSYDNDLKLKRHISINHRDKVGSHTCSLCGIRIRGAYNLARHKRRYHKKNI